MRVGRIYGIVFSPREVFRNDMNIDSNLTTFREYFIALVSLTLWPESAKKRSKVKSNMYSVFQNLKSIRREFFPPIVNQKKWKAEEFFPLWFLGVVLGLEKNQIRSVIAWVSRRIGALNLFSGFFPHFRRNLDSIVCKNSLRSIFIFVEKRGEEVSSSFPWQTNEASKEIELLSVSEIT